MPTSPSFSALLRAYVGEASAWKREWIYREMIEVFRLGIGADEHRRRFRASW